MGEFFHGWRRKAGCVTLVMACIAIGVSLQSLTVRDNINVATGEVTEVGIDLLSGHIGIEFTSRNSPKPKGYPSGWIQFSAIPIHTNAEQFGGWKWYFLGFGALDYTWSAGSSKTWYIPAWSVFGPLTLLSAYLLLSKPRTPMQKPVEPVATIGA